MKWWPAAAAFCASTTRGRSGRSRFARGESAVGRSFAVRGLGAIKDPGAIDLLSELARDWPRDPRTAISAVKALASTGDRRAGPALLALLNTKGLDPLLHVEVVGALGAARVAAAQDLLQDLVTHRSPAVRAAAFRSLRALDPQGFVMVLSGLDTDRDWTVRAELATLMGTLDREPRRRGSRPC